MQFDALTAENERHTVEENCRSIYRETAKFYESRTLRVAGQDFGYRILYGPPVIRPEYIFIGYQPGGKADSVRIEQLRGWPDECEYALDKPSLEAAGWVRPGLAIRMQKVWGVPALKNSTGLNAIFFRAPSMKEWDRVEKQLRTEAEKFSLENVQSIVRMLKPKRLRIIGLGTFDWLTGRAGDPVLARNGRCLVKRGELWGVPTFGVIHLSGARVSGADLEAISAYFAGQGG